MEGTHHSLSLHTQSLIDRKACIWHWSNLIQWVCVWGGCFHANNVGVGGGQAEYEDDLVLLQDDRHHVRGHHQ